MLSNRISSLAKQEQTILKQITIAEQHAKYADEVKVRRIKELHVRDKYRVKIE